MKKGLLGVVIFFISLEVAPSVFPHCEIPCGIYGDEMRLDMMAEHVATIEKSIKLITELSGESEKNFNQIVRWVNNKEKHATNLQHIISQYFMTQRVKPAEEKDGAEYEKYLKQLTLLHQMIVYAMKTKQSTDFFNVEKLKALLEEFRNVYLGPVTKEHSH